MPTRDYVKKTSRLVFWPQWVPYCWENHAMYGISFTRISLEDWSADCQLAVDIQDNFKNKFSHTSRDKNWKNRCFHSNKHKQSARGTRDLIKLFYIGDLPPINPCSVVHINQTHHEQNNRHSCIQSLRLDPWRFVIRPAGTSCRLTVICSFVGIFLHLTLDSGLILAANLLIYCSMVKNNWYFISAEGTVSHTSTGKHSLLQYLGIFQATEDNETMYTISLVYEGIDDKQLSKLELINGGSDIKKRLNWLHIAR